MIRRTLIAAAAATLMLAGAASAAPGGRTGGSTITECGEGVVMHSPTRLWPPNHKFHPIVITYAEGDEQTHDGDTMSITVDAILHDQADPDGSNELNGSGRPNAGLDWGGIGNTDTAHDDEAARTTAQIRAERSGHVEEGRTYTITVTCMSAGGDDGQNSTETVQLTVHVPHSQR